MKHKIKKIFPFILIIVVLSFIICLYANNLCHVNCYHYVKNLGEECYGIRDLDAFVYYDMLSSEYKKNINENEFTFNSDEDIWLVCQKFKFVNSNYNFKKTTYSTHSLRHNPLCAQIVIDKRIYNIIFDITFVPKIFSYRPKIVKWEVSIREVTLSD